MWLFMGVLLPTEERTARLTILIDPRKKEVFERLCAEEDATASQVVRRMIRSYIEERTGHPWAPPPAKEKASGDAVPRRRARSSLAGRSIPLRSKR